MTANPVDIERYGRQVDVSGDWIAVSALVPYAVASNSSTGAVLLLRRDNGGTPTDLSDDTWTEQQKLLASDGPEGEFFGSSVEIEGDVLIIGAPSASLLGEFSGAAYIFRNVGGTWIEEAVLTAFDGRASDRFGRGVAIDGNRVAVGSIDADGSGTNDGAVYLFTYDGDSWSHEAKVFAPAPVAGLSFGTSLSLDGGWLFIGDPNDSEGCPSEDPQCFIGAAHMFRLDGGVWTHDVKLRGSDATTGHYFGVSVAIEGELAVAGVYGAIPVCAGNDCSPGDETEGAGYVFRHSEGVWTEEAKLVPDDAAIWDHVGISVDLSGGKIVLGATQGEGVGGAQLNDAGYATVFMNVGGSWTRQQIFQHTGAETFDSFGLGVALDGDLLVVGAPNVCPSDFCLFGAAFSFDVGCALPIPTVSGWGVVVFALGVLVVATQLLARRFAMTPYDG